jgi:transcriptional regulator with XRE-family HTH domain
VQEKSDSSAKFFLRIEHLRDFLGCSMSDLCKKIGVSRTHLYFLKNDNQEPTNKLWRKLEAAERAAGVQNGTDPGSNGPAGIANNSGTPKETPGGLEKEKSAGDRLEKLEAEVGELREELAGLYELLAGRARGKTQDCKTQDCKTQDPREEEE